MASKRRCGIPVLKPSKHIAVYGGTPTVRRIKTWQPCRAWPMKGMLVCWHHGGRAQKVFEANGDR